MVDLRWFDTQDEQGDYSISRRGLMHQTQTPDGFAASTHKNNVRSDMRKDMS